MAGGEVRCWGDNSSGQLGNGTTTDSASPVAVSGLSGATQITAGWRHTCALVAGGEVRCWGSNFYGQLGNASTADSPTPVTVVELSPLGEPAPLAGSAQISAGFTHTCAIVIGGEVRCWGNNSGPGDPSQNNATGQLGNGSRLPSSSVPVAVRASESSLDLLLLSDATQVTAGNLHTCALVVGGTVRCWGSEFFGQLGTRAVPDVALAPAAAVPGLSGATQIAAGFDHNCALVADGQARCWGKNFSGQVGNGTTSSSSSTPVAVSGLSGATQIAAGFDHNCALVAGGQARCWGNNFSGQLGNGTTTTSSTRVAVSGLSGATQLSGGGGHSCALVAGGQARCWGNNSSGQLGNGTTTGSTVPVGVVGLT